MIFPRGTLIVGVLDLGFNKLDSVGVKPTPSYQVIADFQSFSRRISHKIANLRGTGLAVAFIATITSTVNAWNQSILIEYGWDVPTPTQMHQEIQSMEKRPFDGLIFRLGAGHNPFVLQALDAAKFAEDQQALRDIRFSRFTNNFVLVWASPPAGFDWFDNGQWQTIENNVQVLLGAAKAGRLRGICFDPEPYDFALWHYEKQLGAGKHSFPEYRAKVRQRGMLFIRAMESQMPAPTILTFFHVSMFDRYAHLGEKALEERLEKERWGLMPDFLIGMLEGAGDKTTFIDGNENAYYYTSREQYFRAYHAIRRRALNLIPTSLRDKYDRQVRAGMALYVDHNFGLRQPNPERYLSYKMTQEERARWFEHNTYWALYVTDELVWCYSERMNWWKNQVPQGLEEAIISARQKIADGKPLGFEIEPLIETVKKR